MKALYKIAEDHQEIINAIDSGEFTADQMADTLDGAVGSFEDKAQSVLAYEKGLDSDIDILANEIKRLQARKKTVENKKKAMREYLKTNMQRTGITNIKCPLFSITLSKGRDKLVIDDQDAISSDYVTAEVVEMVDKKRLFSDLKAGVEIDGCHIEKSEESLRIT